MNRLKPITKNVQAQIIQNNLNLIHTFRLFNNFLTETMDTIIDRGFIIQLTNEILDKLSVINFKLFEHL